MKQCLNCRSTNVAIPMVRNSCQTSSCANTVEHCTECICTKTSYCPKCQEVNKFLFNPTARETKLKDENQKLTNQLGLKDTELKDLQAEIRALHTQLTEQENNTPYQIKINKQEVKLELVKKKLKEWNSLLTK